MRTLRIKISKIQVPRCKQNFHWLGTPAELAENIQEHDWNHWMWSMVNMRTLTWELTQIRMMSSLHISPFKLVGMGYKWELNYGNIALCELIWSPSGWAHFIQFSLVITPLALHCYMYNWRWTLWTRFAVHIHHCLTGDRREPWTLRVQERG